MLTSMVLAGAVTSLGPLIKLTLLLAVIGFVLYLIIKYIPMPEIFKQVICVVVAVAVILYLCNYFGLI